MKRIPATATPATSDDAPKLSQEAFERARFTVSGQLASSRARPRDPRGIKLNRQLKPG